MTSSFELRPSTEADHDAIAEIWHESASLPGVGPADMPSQADLRKRVDVEFASGWRVTVALRGEDVVGFLAIKPEAAILCEIFIRPGHLGIGIGQALLSRAMAAMPEGFTLHTRPTNMRARRFYEKAGLVFLREGTHPRSGDAIIYYGWNAG